MPDVREEHEQQRPAPMLQHQGDGLLDVVRVRLHGLEHRALLQRAAEQHGEERDEDAAQEDQAPAPREDVRRRQQLHGHPHERAERSTERSADHDERRVAAALPCRRRLGEQRRAARLFRAGAEALEEAAQHEQRRREQADLVVGGQQADGERRPAHEEERGHEHPLAAEPVAVAREEQAAERPRGESHGVGAEARHDAGRRRDVREEQRAEDEGGRRAVDHEVVPLEHGADEAGPGGHPHVAQFECRCGVRLRSCSTCVVRPRRHASVPGLMF